MIPEYVLITGATGFIGSHVTEELLSDKSYRIVTIVRKCTNYKNVSTLRDKGVILAEGAFYEKSVIEAVFRQFPVRMVIHLAALRGGGLGTTKDYYDVNVLGTEYLLQASLNNQVDKFIFCSSVGVFGTIPKEVPATLKTQLNADNAYHRSKVLAETRVHEAINRGLNAYIVRPTITYGAGDNGFPSTLVELVKRRLFLFPFRDIAIHLLDVTLLAKLLGQILKSDTLGQKVFIAADQGPISLTELVNVIHRHYHGTKYPAFLRLPYPVFHLFQSTLQAARSEKWLTSLLLISQSWYYDITQTIKTLRFKPANTPESFVKQMCN